MILTFLLIFWLLLGSTNMAYAVLSPSQKDAIYTELEAEGKRLLATYFTQCGKDFFSEVSRPGPFVSGYYYPPSTEPQQYVLVQYKDLRFKVQHRTLSKSDRLNDVQWKGEIVFKAAGMRRFYSPERVWSRWWASDGLDNVQSYRVRKENGQVRVSAPEHERRSIDCQKLPR